MSPIYDIQVQRITGETESLASYQGKTLVIVNVASECGLTPQYEQLEKLYEELNDRGLEVLGFPCNQFAGQEPGTESDIQEFCRSNFGVKFPMFSKVEVNGDGRHPLYQSLIREQPEAVKKTDSEFLSLLESKGLLGDDPTDIMWNFEKFLVNAEGEVVARFAPDITVDDKVFREALEMELPPNA